MVTLLANQETPTATREWFRRNNPLPGADWSDNNVLLNADEIMPARYNITAFQPDLIAVRNLTTAYGRYVREYCKPTPTQFLGVGNVSVLVSWDAEDGSLTLYGPL